MAANIAATSTVHRSVVERANPGNCIRLFPRAMTEAFRSSACLGEYLRGLERSGHAFLDMVPPFALVSPGARPRSRIHGPAATPTNLIGTKDSMLRRLV